MRDVTRFRRRNVGAMVISAALAIPLVGCMRHAPPGTPLRVSTPTRQPRAEQSRGRTTQTTTPRERRDAGPVEFDRAAVPGDDSGTVSMGGDASEARHLGAVGTSSSPSGTVTTTVPEYQRGPAESSNAAPESDTSALIPRWALLLAAGVFIAMGIAAAYVLTRGAPTVSRAGTSRKDIPSIAAHRKRRVG